MQKRSQKNNEKISNVTWQFTEVLYSGKENAAIPVKPWRIKKAQQKNSMWSPVYDKWCDEYSIACVPCPPCHQSDPGQTPWRHEQVGLRESTGVKSVLFKLPLPIIQFHAELCAVRILKVVPSLRPCSDQRYPRDINKGQKLVCIVFCTWIFP